jgi:hypothetical protein
MLKEAPNYIIQLQQAEKIRFQMLKTLKKAGAEEVLPDCFTLPIKEEENDKKR